MSKRQTRRSISIKGITYQRLKSWCDANNKTCSGYLEEIIAEKLDAAGVPEETVLRPVESRTIERDPDPEFPPGRRMY